MSYFPKYSIPNILTFSIKTQIDKVFGSSISKILFYNQTSIFWRFTIKASNISHSSTKIPYPFQSNENSLLIGSISYFPLNPPKSWQVHCQNILSYQFNQILSIHVQVDKILLKSWLIFWEKNGRNDNSMIFSKERENQRNNIKNRTKLWNIIYEKSIFYGIPYDIL